MTIQKPKKSTIAILNLDASISIYQEALRFISYSLFMHNTNVIHLGCHGALQRCVNINALPEIVRSSDIEAKKEFLCAYCRKQQNKIFRHQSHAATLNLDKLNIDQEEFITKIGQNLLNDPRAVSIIAEKYHEIDICKIAFFDFSIAGKMSPESLLTEEEQRRFIEHIADLFVLINFLKRVSVSCDIGLVLYVNGNYSQNSLARSVLQNNCREFISVEFQFSSVKARNRIFFEKDRLVLLPKWPSISALDSHYKLRLSDLKAGLHIMKNRFLGNDYNSYTKPSSKSVNAEFDSFRNKYKTILSYFSCSTDEIYSHIVTHGVKIDQTFYPDQYELIHDFIVNARDDIGYVIRVHPRLAPNKRDRVVSREIAEINKYLDMARAKKNFFIIEASNPLSSYYVLLKSDLIIVAWSTIALEAMIAGKPAIALFPLDCVYPIRELCKQPKDVNEYRRILRGEIPSSIITIDDINLMRWVAMVYSALSHSIPSPRESTYSLPVRLYNFLYRRLLSSNLLYRIAMIPAAMSSTAVNTGILNRHIRQLQNRTVRDDLSASRQELQAFRKKIRDIILH